MPQRTLEDLLQRYPEPVQELARAARAFVLRQLPGALEIVDGTAPVVGYGFGAGYKDMVCTLLLSRKGVKLGLSNGAALADPEGLLEGSGKVHRFVALGSAGDLRRPALARLVQAADAARRERDEPRRSPGADRRR